MHVLELYVIYINDIAHREHSQNSSRKIQSFRNADLKEKKYFDLEHDSQFYLIGGAMSILTRFAVSNFEITYLHMQNQQWLESIVKDKIVINKS